MNKDAIREHIEILKEQLEYARSELKRHRIIDHLREKDVEFHRESIERLRSRLAKFRKRLHD